jgi:hypothetical protein
MFESLWGHEEKVMMGPAEQMRSDAAIALRCSGEGEEKRWKGKGESRFKSML